MRTLGKLVAQAVALACLLTLYVAQPVVSQTVNAPDPCADTPTIEAFAKKTADAVDSADAKIRRQAIPLATEFIQRWGKCPAPDLQELVAAVKETRLQLLFESFDDALRVENAEVMFTVGKQILSEEPENLNVIFPLVIVASKEALAGKRVHNADAVKYGTLLLTNLRQGVALTKKNGAGKLVVGALQYEMTREDAISETLFCIGAIKFFGDKDKPVGLNYLYEAIKTPGVRKDSHRLYAIIGEFYEDEMLAMIRSDREKKATPRVPLYAGYAERAMDAYARSWTFAASAGEDVRNRVYQRIEQLYQVRFGKETGVGDYIVSTVRRSFPNPNSEVIPMIDP